MREEKDDLIIKGGAKFVMGPNDDEGTYMKREGTAPDAGGVVEPSLVRALRLTAPGSSWQKIIDYIDALRAEAERLRGDVARLANAYVAEREVLLAYKKRAEKAEARDKAMRDALESVISEASWFVARKKNLAEYTGNADETWASVLDADLNIGRRTLRDTARAKLDAARKEKP